MSNPIQSTPKKSPFAQTLLFFVGGAILGGVLTTGFFLSQQSQKSVSTKQLVGESLFKVDGNMYSSTNLPADTSMDYYQLENSVYEAKLNLVNQIALRIALAKDSGKGKNQELPALEELLPVSIPTDTEVTEYYNSITSRYGQNVFGGQNFESIKEQLKQQLAKQKREQEVNTKIQELTSNGRIVSLLTKAEAPAVELNLTGYPSRGNTESSVTLVEISDYMCPHCRETEPTIEKLYKEFGDKVNFVQVSFPLNPNGLNGALARGAYCASEQGVDMFWKYHEHAFQVPWTKMTPPSDKPALEFFDSEAIEVAKLSDLNLESFNSCLESEKAKQYITDLQSEFNAQKGFQGTPTFYVNNRLVQANPAQLEATLRDTLKQISAP